MGHTVCGTTNSEILKCESNVNGSEATLNTGMSCDNDDMADLICQNSIHTIHIHIILNSVSQLVGHDLKMGCRNILSGLPL